MRRTFLCLIILVGLLHPIGAVPLRPLASLFTPLERVVSVRGADDLHGQSSRGASAHHARHGLLPIGQPTALRAPCRSVHRRASPITLTATIDLTETKLIPFSTVSYWWEVVDAAGNTARSETQTLIYVDNRFAWQELAAGPVRVHWYQGDSGFGSAAASCGQ